MKKLYKKLNLFEKLGICAVILTLIISSLPYLTKELLKAEIDYKASIILENETADTKRLSISTSEASYNKVVLYLDDKEQSRSTITVDKPAVFYVNSTGTYKISILNAQDKEVETQTIDVAGFNQLKIETMEGGSTTWKIISTLPGTDHFIISCLDTKWEAAVKVQKGTSYEGEFTPSYNGTYTIMAVDQNNDPIKDAITYEVTNLQDPQEKPQEPADQDNDVIHINNEAELKRIDDHPEASYVLDRDIIITDETSEFLVSKTFTGTLQGNGYQIKGLTQPVFASIKDAAISNVSLQGAWKDKKGALLALSSEHSTYTGIAVNAELEGKEKLAGMLLKANKDTITKSYVSGYINGKQTAGFFLEGTGTIEDSYVSGMVKAEDEATGFAKDAVIKNAYLSATVTGKDILLFNQEKDKEKNLIDCYYDINLQEMEELRATPLTTDQITNGEWKPSDAFQPTKGAYPSIKQDKEWSESAQKSEALSLMALPLTENIHGITEDISLPKTSGDEKLEWTNEGKNSLSKNTLEADVQDDMDIDTSGTLMARSSYGVKLFATGSAKALERSPMAGQSLAEKTTQISFNATAKKYYIIRKKTDVTPTEPASHKKAIEAGWKRYLWDGIINWSNLDWNTEYVLYEYDMSSTENSKLISTGIKTNQGLIGGSVTLSNNNAVGTEITATLSEDALIKEGSWTWERSKSLASGWEKITNKQNVDTDQTTSKYTPTTEDARYYIRVTFNVTPDKNFKGSVSETTSTVIREALTEVKIYKGDQEVTEADMVAHNLLRAEVTPNGFESDVTFEWYHEGDNTIQGVGKEYLLSGKDIGKSIIVKAIPRGDGGVSNEISSTPTVVVKKAPLAKPTYSIKLVSYTDTSLTVNLPDATSGLYHFAYLEPNTDNWVEWTVNARANNSTTIRGLKANTYYQIRYKQIGENGYEDSDWAANDEFKTDLPHIKGTIVIDGERVFGQQLTSHLTQGELGQKYTAVWYIIDDNDPSYLRQLSTGESPPIDDPEAIGRRLKVVYKGLSANNWSGEVSAQTEIIKKASVAYPGKKFTTLNSKATGPYTIKVKTPMQDDQVGALSESEKFIIGYSLTENGVPIEYSEDSNVMIFDPNTDYTLKGFQRNTTYYFFLRYAETNVHYKSDWQPVSMSTKIKTEEDPVVGSINFTYESVTAKPIQGEKLTAYLDGVNAASGTWSWTRILPNGGAEEAINNYYPDGNNKTYIIVPTDEEPGTKYKVVFTPEEGYSGILDNTSEAVQKFVLSPYVTPSVSPIKSKTISPTDTTLTFKMPDTASEGAVYEFKYGTVNNVINENNKVVITKAYKNTDVTITGLDRNKTYYIWVRQVGDDTHSDSEWNATPLTLSTIRTDLHGYVTISDTPVANEELSATYTSASYIPAGNDTKDGTWQWYRANGSDWVKIENATTDKYTPTSNDINKQLKAVYTGGGDFKDEKYAVSNPVRKSYVTRPEIIKLEQGEDSSSGYLTVNTTTDSDDIWYRFQIETVASPEVPSDYSDQAYIEQKWTHAAAKSFSIEQDYNGDKLKPNTNYVLYIMNKETNTEQASDIISRTVNIGQLTQRGSIIYSGNAVVGKTITATLSEDSNNNNGTWKWYISKVTCGNDGKTTVPDENNPELWTQIASGYSPTINSSFSNLNITEDMWEHYVKAEFNSSTDLGFKGKITKANTNFVKKIYDETITLDGKGYKGYTITGTVNNYVDSNNLNQDRSYIKFKIDSTEIADADIDGSYQYSDNKVSIKLKDISSWADKKISLEISKPKNYWSYVDTNLTNLTNSNTKSSNSIDYINGTTITNADEFISFMLAEGQYSDRSLDFVITENINLSNKNAITPSRNTFTGNLNGDYHTVVGLKNPIFFKILGTDSKKVIIKNLIFTNCVIPRLHPTNSSERNAILGVNGGGGFIDLSRILLVDANVSGFDAAMLITTTESGTLNVSECGAAKGTMNAQSSGGGLVGYVNNTTTIIDSFSISSNIGTNYISGLGGGYLQGITVKNSYSSNIINSTNVDSGGIARKLNSTTSENAFYDKTVAPASFLDGPTRGTGVPTEELLGYKLQSKFDIKSSGKWLYAEGYYPRLTWLNDVASKTSPGAVDTTALYAATRAAFTSVDGSTTSSDIFSGTINGAIQVPLDFQKKGFTFSSTDSTVLLVTEGGTITPVGNPGAKATITVTYNDEITGGKPSNTYEFTVGTKRSGFSRVTISGQSRVGQNLTASSSPAATSYQWFRRKSDGSDETIIQGATSSSYKLTPQDAGYVIYAKALRSGYSSGVSSISDVVEVTAPTKAPEITEITDSSVKIKGVGGTSTDYEYAYQEEGSSILTVSTNKGSSIEITGLNRNKNYTFYSRIAGGDGYSASDWSPNVTKRTLKTPISGEIKLNGYINSETVLRADISDINLQIGDWIIEKLNDSDQITDTITPTGHDDYYITYQLKDSDAGYRLKITYKARENTDYRDSVSIITPKILKRVQNAPAMAASEVANTKTDNSLTVQETKEDADTKYEFGYRKSIKDDIQLVSHEAVDANTPVQITNLERNTIYYVYVRKASKELYEASSWSDISVQIPTSRTSITSSQISIVGDPKVDEELTFSLNSLIENTKDQTGLWVLERVKGSETNTLIPTTTNDGKITYKVVPEDSGSEIKASFVGTGDYEGRTDITTSTIENASQEIGAIKPTISSTNEYSIKVKVAEASNDIFEFGYQKLNADGNPEGNIIAYPITVAWGNNLDINPQDTPLTRDTGYRVYVRKAAKVGYNNSDWSSAVSARTQKSALKGNVKLVRGTTAIGQTLEVTYEKGSYPDNADDTEGTWQWYIGDQEIPDATESSYTVAATEDNPEISVIYTARENSGFTGSVSRNFGAVHKDPYPVPAAAETTAKDSDNTQIGSVITVKNTQIDDVYIYLRESSNSKLPELVKASDITNTELSTKPEENIERWIPAKDSMDILVPANRSYVIYSARLTSGTNEASGISSTRGTTSAKEPLLRNPITDGQIMESDANVPWKALQAKTLEYSLMGTIAPTASWKYYVRPDDAGKWQNIDSELDALGRVDGISEDQTKSLSTISLPLKYTGYQLKVELTGIDDYEGTVEYFVANIEGKLIDAGGASIIKSDTTQIFDVLKAKYSGTDKAPGSFTWYRETSENSGEYEIVSVDGKITEDDDGSNYQTDVNDYKKRIYAVYTASPESEYSGTSSTDMVLVSEKANQNQPVPVEIKQVNGNSIQVIAPNNYVTANMDTIPDVVLGYAKCDENGNPTSSITWQMNDKIGETWFKKLEKHTKYRFYAYFNGTEGFKLSDVSNASEVATTENDLFDDGNLSITSKMNDSARNTSNASDIGNGIHVTYTGDGYDEGYFSLKRSNGEVINTQVAASTDSGAKSISFDYTYTYEDIGNNIIVEYTAKDEAKHYDGTISKSNGVIVTKPESKETAETPTMKRGLDTDLLVEIKDGYEYCLDTSASAPAADSGDWNILEENKADEPRYHDFLGLERTTTYYLHARIAETKETQASEAVTSEGMTPEPYIDMGAGHTETQVGNIKIEKTKTTAPASGSGDKITFPYTLTPGKVTLSDMKLTRQSDNKVVTLESVDTFVDNDGTASDAVYEWGSDKANERFAADLQMYNANGVLIDSSSGTKTELTSEKDGSMQLTIYRANGVDKGGTYIWEAMLKDSEGKTALLRSEVTFITNIDMVVPIRIDMYLEGGKYIKQNTNIASLHNQIYLPVVIGVDKQARVVTDGVPALKGLWKDGTVPVDGEAYLKISNDGTNYTAPWNSVWLNTGRSESKIIDLLALGHNARGGYYVSGIASETQDWPWVISESGVNEIPQAYGIKFVTQISPKDIRIETRNQLDFKDLEE